MERAVLIDIRKKVAEIPLSVDEFLIGRSLQNALVLEEVNISRTHCMMYRHQDGWYIVDKSSNGTWLNDELLDKTKSYKLTSGDIISLNDTVKFVFKISSSDKDRPVVNTNKRPLDEENVVVNTKKRPLNEEDIMNIAESVIADVQAFQAEYDSEKFDENIFTDVHKSNSDVNKLHANLSDSKSSNTNAELNSINILSPVDVHQPTVMSVLHQVLGSTAGSANTHHETKIPKQLESSTGSPQPSISATKENLNIPEPKTKTSNLDYAEDELQCSICTEMFIHAVTLSCSHTFCDFCIKQWQKNQSVCPICRAKITMQFATRVVDNFIEKILQNASEELKDHRRKLLAERLAISASMASTSTTNRRRPTQDPIEISSSSDEENTEEELESSNLSYYSGSDWEDDYDDEDWNDYNGLPGRYYGGYGQCYTCGQRGHWSNGCPHKRKR